MTEREAIEIIKPIEQSARATSCGGFEQRPIVTALQMAIKALEKQIPKKPKVNHYEEEGEKPYTKICCPNDCRIQLSPVTEKQLAHEHVYCPKCGQRIDWLEVEE